MKQKKKILNLRLFFIGFVGVIFGILTFYHLLNLLWLNNLTIWFVLLLLLFLSSLALLGICIKIKSCHRYLKYLIIFILLFVVGFGSFYSQISKFAKLKTYDDEAVIRGRVSSSCYSGSGYVINLKDCLINDLDNVSNIKVYLVLDGSEVVNELSNGYMVELNAKVSLYQLVTDKIDVSRVASGVSYSAYAMSRDVVIVDKTQNFVDLLQSNLKRVLDSGLSNENADIAYGLLVGDKSELDSDVKDSFSYAGISHILAVSGLHVGFLVLVLTFILNICKVGRRNRFFITSAVLLIYCLICGFSASVLRATFMSMVLLLSGVVGKEYDGLNSLGVAGIVILLISPLDLFNLGFQLSFMCVFMIITLTDKLGKVMINCGIHKSIALPISISICTTMGSSIILANSLYEISFVSLISNLIVIPMFSIIYPVLFICSVVAMIVPPVSGILCFPEIMLHLLKLITNFFASWEFAQFRVFNLGYILLFVFILFSFLVKFFMCDKRIKIVATSILFLSCIVMAICGSIPSKFNSFSMYTNYQYSDNSALITTVDNKKILVGIDDYSTVNFLTGLKVDNIDLLVLPDFEINQMDNYIEFLGVVNVEKIVIPTNSLFVDKVFDRLRGFVDIAIVDTYNNEIELDFIKSKDVVCGTKIRVNNKILLFTNGITKEKLTHIGKGNCVYDYIVTNESKYDFREFGIEYRTIVCSNGLNFEENSVISLKNKSLYVLEL